MTIERRKVVSALILLATFFVPSVARAGSSAGIEVRAGSFSIETYYNTVVEYPSGADRLVRDPKHLLFDILLFVDANYDALSNLNRQIRIDILQADSKDAEDVALVEEAGPGASEQLIRFEAGKDIAERIVSLLCGYLEEKCNKPIGIESVTLHKCRTDKCPGIIKFGNIPSGRCHKYSLRPESKEALRFVITRKNISDHFKPLQ